MSTEELATKFDNAIDFAVALAQRNYKFIVPMYRPQEDMIQLLMPIYGIICYAFINLIKEALVKLFRVNSHIFKILAESFNERFMQGYFELSEFLRLRIVRTEP